MALARIPEPGEKGGDGGTAIMADKITITGNANIVLRGGDGGTGGGKGNSGSVGGSPGKVGTQGVQFTSTPRIVNGLVRDQL